MAIKANMRETCGDETVFDLVCGDRTPTLLVKVHGIIKYISIIHKCSNTQMSACKMAKLW